MKVIVEREPPVELPITKVTIELEGRDEAARLLQDLNKVPYKTAVSCDLMNTLTRELTKR